MDVSLGELADIRLGYPFRTRVIPNPQGETALVQLADLNGGELSPDGLVRVQLGSVRVHFPLRPGDILFRARGQVNDATLVSAVEAGAGIVRVLAAAPIMVIRMRALGQPPNGRGGAPEVRPRYLHWLLNHPHTQADLRSRSTGHSAEVLRKGDLEGLSLPVPPVEVQDLIVETATELAREMRQRRRLMEERRDMVLSLLLHQARTPDRSRDTPPAPEGRLLRQGLLFGDMADGNAASGAHRPQEEDR